MAIQPDFLDELARFDAALKKEVNSIFQGEQESKELGEGLTFSDYRNYTPGDDTRLIDWRVYARTEELYIKQFEEERNLTIHVLIDASRSMGFGEGDDNKFEYAAKIGLGFAYLAADENNDFRVSVFGDGFKRLDTGGSNRGEILRLIDLLNEEGEDLEGETDFRKSFEEYESTIGSKSLVLIASDFLGDTDGIAEGLSALAKHDVTLAHVIAPDERELPARGDTIFEALESDTSLRTYFSNRLKTTYQNRLENHISSIDEISDEVLARHVVINTGDDFFDSFAKTWVE